MMMMTMMNMNQKRKLEDVRKNVTRLLHRKMVVVLQKDVRNEMNRQIQNLNLIYHHHRQNNLKKFVQQQKFLQKKLKHQHKIKFQKNFMK